MSSNMLASKMNLPLLAAMAVLVFSISTIAAMWVTSPANAKRPGPPYSSAMSVRDDGCYSTLGTVSNISTLLGGASFGLVNAVVNVPVYDWDQSPNTLFTVQSHTPAAGLRGNLGGNVVGYAQDFDFKVTPVPNLWWMGQYFTKQLPYDAGQLALLAGGVNPLANSGIGKSPQNPFIANPFIYQQGAILFPNGIPRIQVITGPLTNPQGSGNWLNSMNPATMLTNLQGMLGAGDTLLSQNGDVVSDVQNGGIRDLVGSLTTSSAALAGQAAKLLIESPLLAPATVQYNVNGDRAVDQCYESLTGSKKVPAYAFSVLDSAIPITIPGWLYTPITLLDGKGFSSAGMTLYPPGSINGKDLLDCYGRGVQPIVTGSGQYKLGDFSIPGYAGASGRFMIPILGQIWGIAAVGLGSYLVNTGVAAAITAASLAADAAAPGTGSSVASVAFRLPAIETAFETYTSGFAYGFLLPNNAIKRLPDYMNNRVVDYNNSSIFSINGTYLIGSDGTNHALSQNGKQFNPDLYVKLKKPYELEPVFEIDNQPADARRDKLDGTTVQVNISNKKSGFEKGNTTIRDSTNVYRPSDSDRGGPTYDDNPGGSNRSFTRASVYRIIMKPGVIPNAIDVDKRASGSQTAYLGAELGASTDSCNFLRQKIIDGDTSTTTGGRPSTVTGNNANSGRPEFDQPDSFQCDYATRSDGSQVRDVEVRMNSSTDLADLYDFAEKIPAETEPGTKYCYAVYYDSFGNDIKFAGREWWNNGRTNYNPNYNAATDKRFLSKAKCIISGYKPSMQVRGGDLTVNGGVYTGTNTKDFLASGTDPKELRTYGSWAEYGIIASGTVSRMGSGAIYRTGLIPTMEELGYLTYANNRDSSGNADYGRYAAQVDDGFDRVTRQFTAMSDQADMSLATRNDVNLSTLDAGVYMLRPNATVNVTADGVLPSNRSIILLAQENTIVNIASNIQIPTEYSSIGDISQVVVAPATESTDYKLNINHTVAQVDAWLINPQGTINTCRTGQPVGNVENIPRSRGLCDSRLTVNGPVSAELLMLRRNGGKDQGTETTVSQSIPGENFNLRPDAYIWAASYVDSASKKYVTTNTIDLPPRY